MSVIYDVLKCLKQQGAIWFLDIEKGKPETMPHKKSFGDLMLFMALL